MKTPITDLASYDDATPGFEVVSADLARRLELDRASLMEALVVAIAQMERVDGENDCSRGIDAAESALAAARANFPTE
jgi:hypothetical protein